MDRRVKERLVGASILVVLIVLIVPELLSGPASRPAAPPTTSRTPVSTPEPVRNVTVDLATSKASTQQGSVDEAASAPSGQTSGDQSAGGQSSAAASGESSAARSLGARAQASAAEPAAVAAAAVAAAAVPAATPPAAAAPRATARAPLESAVPPPTYVPGGAKSSAAGHAWTVQLGSFANRENADKLLRRWKGQGFAIYVSSSGAGSALRYRVRIGPLADRGAAAQTVAKLKSLGQAASILRPGA